MLSSSNLRPVENAVERRLDDSDPWHNENYCEQLGPTLAPGSRDARATGRPAAARATGRRFGQLKRLVETPPQVLKVVCMMVAGFEFVLLSVILATWSLHPPSTVVNPYELAPAPSLMTELDRQGWLCCD